MKHLGYRTLQDNWTIYNEFYQNFRVNIKDVASSLRIDRHTASKRIRDVLESGIVTAPQLRKHSYRNFREYMYLVHCDDPFEVYKKYKDDTNVVHHAVLGGFGNLWVIAKKEMDIKGEILAEGPRSDYHVAYSLTGSWDESTELMRERIDTCSLREYEPRTLVRSRWNEVLEWWDPDFEILYRELKYDGRKAYTPIMKEHEISSHKIDEFFTLLPHSCLVAVRFFPKGMSEYDPYLFLIETEYEDLVIEVFSQLPTSTFFVKVEDYLLVHAYVERSSMREDGIIWDVSQMKLHCLLEKMKKKGIVKSERHAIFECHWSKDI
ncbi:MAG: hypothetical protein HXS41_04905 [Theionarchaea archaeon]|nr:hypothetical protein [Theionarchaea archaeon]MBU6999622.1 hypothetical protein [Theionarchaea archaeon]MBU7020374.1 hypothetical protein [Theionarchaea archaeon]MBU7035323.1 hypothetical protein [Theionarchaea archaeon]MBU7041474.1 hypothetical protein [Theionarchaea archaeon]